jgi:hypothetical protein
MLNKEEPRAKSEKLKDTAVSYPSANLRPSALAEQIADCYKVTTVTAKDRA